MVGNICAEILLDRVHILTEDLINDEQGDFRSGSGCVEQILTLRKIGKKAREKKPRVYVGFMDLEKPYDKVYREAL